MDRNRRNFACAVSGEALWGVLTSLTASATVLTVLLLEFGAGPKMIGAVATIDSAFILLPQVAGIYIFKSHRTRKRRLVVFHVISIVSFIFLMSVLSCLAPSMPASVYRWCMFAAHGGFMLMIGVVVAAWMDWMAHLFDRGTRGKVIGTSMAVSALCGTGGAVAAGWIIGHVASPYCYAVLYAAGGIMGLLSMAIFARVDDPATQQADETPRPTFGVLLRQFHSSMQDGNFRAFLVGRVLAAAGFSILPFLAVYYTLPIGGGLARGTVVSLGAAMTLGTAMASWFTGRLGDRHGHRSGILLGAVAQTVTVCVVLFSSGFWSCLAAYAGAGVCLGVGVVSHYNMLLETCPHDSRIAHITVGNLVMGLATMFLPLFAGAVVAAWGLRFMFSLSLAFSVLALAWFLWRVKDPRQIELRR